MRTPELILMICAAASLMSGCTAKREARREALAGLNLPDLSEARFESTREQDMKGIHIHDFTGSIGSAEVSASRMEKVDEATAERVLKQKRFQLESLSQEQRSPYPGEISSSVKCTGTFLPAIKDFKTGEARGLRIEAAASSRKVVGVCQENEIAFETVFVYMYCAKKKLLVLIEAYFPRGKRPAGFLSSPSC